MSKAILILGMHRSGTSALTRVMSLMGVALPKSILGKNTSNLRGHWESEAMIAAHDTLLMQQGSSWTDWRRFNMGKKGSRAQRGAAELFIETFDSEFSKKDGVCVVKEPRICRFAAPYIQALEVAGVELHSLLMVRNPLEVAASLSERDGLTKLDGLYLWLTHMLEAELATRKGSRNFISYDDFLSSPVKAVKFINKSLPFSLPYEVSDVKKQIEVYVSPSLKRQSRAAEDIVLDPLARGWLSDAYEAFLVLCENPQSKVALATLDDIRESYFSVIEPLHEILTFERARLDGDFSDILASHLSAHEAAVDKLQCDHEQAWKEREKETAESWQTREDDNAKAWQTLEDDNAKAWRTREEENARTLEKIESEHAVAFNLQQESFTDTLEHLQSEHSKAIAEWERSFASQEANYQATFSKMNDEISFMRDEFGSILRATEARADHGASEAKAVRAELSSVLSSTSWKMTSGLRRVMNALKGVKTPKPSRHLETPEPAPRLEFKPKD